MPGWRKRTEHGGKRVSWVELYLDLIFVLAVGQLSHLIVHEPEMQPSGSRSGCS